MNDFPKIRERAQSWSTRINHDLLTSTTKILKAGLVLVRVNSLDSPLSGKFVQASFAVSREIIEQVPADELRDMIASKVTEALDEWKAANT